MDRANCRTQQRIAVLFAIALAAGPLAVLAAKIQFHLEAGDATGTLTEFSRQAGLQLLFDYNIVKGHETPALEGAYEPEEALRILLANTDLRFEWVNPRTLTVIPNRSGESIERGAGAKPRARRTRPRAGPADQARGAPGPLPEVRVTGTILRGEPPVGEQTLRFIREHIEHSGASTVAQFLRTVPQVFGGGPSQYTRIGVEAQTNSGLGTGVNLRGLGARATLVLINGRRLAPGGSAGAFVDIESIPLAAVERIDILPDSASALYGADAVGGVINFVMRENVPAAETVFRLGSGTQHELREYELAHTLGRKWDSGSGLLSFELYHRGALPASARRYAVSDLRPFGGGDYDTQFANPGNIVAGQQLWAIPAGQDGTHLSAAQLVPGAPNRQNQYLATDLTPSQRLWSVYGTGRQEINARLRLFSDVLFTNRDAAESLGGFRTPLSVPATNPFYVNPAGGTAPVTVDYNFGRDLGPQRARVNIKTTNATLGLDLDAGNWNISAYGNYAQEKQSQSVENQVSFTALQAALADMSRATAFNPFGDGSHTNPATLDSIRARSWFRMNSQLKVADITAGGPIARLPGGALKLAVGTDLREQFFATTTPLSNGVYVSSSSGRRTTAAFGELMVPLVGDRNPLPFVSKLELSAAARYENYAGVGHATTPKYGLVWSPVPGLSLRGTWSRSIRAPSLSDLDDSHNVSVSLLLPDSSSQRGGTMALLWSGNNSTLQEEHADSWTAGLDWVPQQLPGLSLGLTYFAISFQDRIQSALFASQVLNDPQYADIVTRNPSPALIDYICNHTRYVMGTTAACTRFAAGAVVDLRLHNVASLITRGVDFNGSWERQGSYGKLKVGLQGTWIAKFAQADAPSQPLTSRLDTQNNPLNLRLHALADWEREAYGTTVGVNFTNSYRDTASRPTRSVGSWTTVDMQLRYDVPAQSGTLLENVRLEIDAQNVFNLSPPFLNNQVVGLGYDQENADPYGRLLSLQVRKRW